MKHMHLEEKVTAPMPLPPGWNFFQSQPQQLTRGAMVPARFYAVAPYQAYRLRGELEQTVTADSYEDLAKLAWEQQHKYEVWG